ncbi:MAG: GGDEF domain-containing protein [Planctomycetota bacterium]|jgi:diguanylate cyclase (GGDEF)-like protein
MAANIFIITIRIIAITCSIALLLVGGEIYFIRKITTNFDKIAFICTISSSLILLLIQHKLGTLFKNYNTMQAEYEDDKFEFTGLKNLVEGLEKDRNLLRMELERIKPEQALSSAAQAHDTLDDFIASLTSLVARNLSDAREMTIFKTDEQREVRNIPMAHYRTDNSSELFLVFTAGGGEILEAEISENSSIPASKFGIRNINVENHHTEIHISAELGFTTADRRRKPVGNVRFKAKRINQESETDKNTAKDILKAQVASVSLDSINVNEALTTRMPQRFDSKREILELACRLGTESEHIGIVKVSFNTRGIDINEKVQVWEHLTASSAQHIARAIRGQGFQERAIKDGLTGLYNKSYMLECLESSFENTRENGVDLSLIMIDIDHFKSVNDTYGHMTGDIVLKGVAGEIASAARATDVAFRYGGEEMGFILSGQNARKALNLANRVRKKIEKQSFVGEKGDIIKVTISLGVSHYTEDMKTHEDLISRSDQALYYSKENGRNLAVAWGSKKMSVRKS